MLHSQFAVYLGAERQSGYTGFIVDTHHFVVVDVEEGFDQAQGHALVSRLKEKLHSHRIIDITHIDSIVDAIMQEFNVPPGFSLSMGI
jgi:ActR/RegA family two-component response regulator